MRQKAVGQWFMADLMETLFKSKTRIDGSQKQFNQSGFTLSDSQTPEDAKIYTKYLIPLTTLS